MNIIADILKMKPKKYGLMVFDFYVFWCELNSNNSKQMQSMLSNQALYNWFINQFERLELEFYDKVGSANMPLHKISKIYLETTQVIGERFPPKSLLKKVIKNGLQNAKSTTNINLN